MASNPLKHKYIVTMTGANQVPPAGIYGSGTAKVIVDGSNMTVCATIKVSGLILPTTGAHIHQAPVGVNGPIVIGFTPPAGKKANSTTGRSHSCVSQVSPTLISALLNNPSDFYVNVHTTDWPNGAIRAQLP
jgi:hypothetical protein